MPICLWTFSSNGLPGILKEKDRVRCLPKGHLTLTEQGKGHGKKCCQWFISWPSYSKTCPAVSWFCSELHFRHTFLRTNIMQHCIRNFLPFPFITDKSVCTVVGMWEMSSSQVLLVLKCELPHDARKSCLGRKAFGGLSFWRDAPCLSHSFSLPGIVCRSRPSPRLWSSAEGAAISHLSTSTHTVCDTHTVCTCCLFW